MRIRPETPADIAVVREINQLAFGQLDEAKLVDALRGSAAWIPELSLVAEESGAVIGAIVFTHMSVRDGETLTPALALAPVAVHPSRQNSGVGTRLVREGIGRARQLGHGIVIVLGHPPYYPRFGFEPAGPRGIRFVQPGHEAAFMVMALRPGALDGVRGVSVYAPPFGI